MNEAAVQQHTRLELARAGALVFRNNVGACMDLNGRMIRYGLGNDSKQLNEKIKSSDLIAVVPTVITQDMVGQTIGVFAAIECKESGWHLTAGNLRGIAQQKFIDLVKGVGGFGGFVTDPAQVHGIIKR